jgi:voltage-gated sodium channel
MVKRLSTLLTAEALVASIIVLNTAALVVMGYAEHETPWAAVARWVDYGCVVYFSIETLLEVRSAGWRTFWHSRWNRFDLTVVVLSSPVLLLPLFEVEGLATLLVLRLGRLFRLFRVLRFIPNREHLYRGMTRALRASVGVFLALLLLNIAVSVGATQLFGRYLPEHFGNPLLSSYTIFRVFTVEGWSSIPDAIAATAPPAIGVLARLYFVATVLCGGILGLSLANAVFVDEMTMDNTQGVEAKVDELVREIRQLRAELEAKG